MLKVTCAIIIQNKKILITQRSINSDQPLQWEFPGGKIKCNEKEEDCIKREILEELDIEIEVQNKLNSIVYNYGFIKISLIPFLSTIKTGTIKLNEHVDYYWASINDLEKFNLSEADKNLVKNSDNKIFLEKYIRKQKNNSG